MSPGAVCYHPLYSPCGADEERAQSTLLGGGTQVYRTKGRQARFYLQRAATKKVLPCLRACRKSLSVALRTRSVAPAARASSCGRYLAGVFTGQVESEGIPSRPARFKNLLTRPDPSRPVIFQTPPDPSRGPGHDP